MKAPRHVGRMGRRGENLEMMETPRFCLQKTSIESRGTRSTEARAMASAQPRLPESSRGRESANAHACF